MVEPQNLKVTKVTYSLGLRVFEVSRSRGSSQLRRSDVSFATTQFTVACPVRTSQETMTTSTATLRSIPAATATAAAAISLRPFLLLVLLLRRVLALGPLPRSWLRLLIMYGDDCDHHHLATIVVLASYT